MIISHISALQERLHGEQQKVKTLKAETKVFFSFFFYESVYDSDIIDSIFDQTDFTIRIWLCTTVCYLVQSHSFFYSCSVVKTINRKNPISISFRKSTPRVSSSRMKWRSSVRKSTRTCTFSNVSFGFSFTFRLFSDLFFVFVLLNQFVRIAMLYVDVRMLDVHMS